MVEVFGMMMDKAEFAEVMAMAKAMWAGMDEFDRMDYDDYEDFEDFFFHAHLYSEE